LAVALRSHGRSIGSKTGCVMSFSVDQHQSSGWLSYDLFPSPSPALNAKEGNRVMARVVVDCSSPIMTLQVFPMSALNAGTHIRVWDDKEVGLGGRQIYKGPEYWRARGRPTFCVIERRLP
jgi:hypothetical protein